jgi:competence protein ComEC
MNLAFCFSTFPFKFRASFFLAVCLLFYLPPRRYINKLSKDAELVFLDVGQGNATFIRFDDGKKVLIDGGGASSKKFNVGESVIAPYLWHKGITRLDAILITHPDADHYNGIPFLLRRFKPDILWINGDSGHDQHYEDLLDLARALKVHIQTVTGEQLLIKGNIAELRSIHNPLQNSTDASSNDKSIILRFSDDEFSCLLTGDISKNVEEIIGLKKENLRSTILLAAHHGSKTSNSDVFLNRVKPKQIIVSAGRFHPDFFPSSELRSFCKKEQIPLLITAEYGAISVTSHGEKFDFFLTR